jgi:hypothetical protein
MLYININIILFFIFSPPLLSSKAKIERGKIRMGPRKKTKKQKGRESNQGIVQSFI